MEFKFIVPGPAVPAVRTTQRKKYVCPYFARYQDYKSFFQLTAQNANKQKWYADKGTPVSLTALVYLSSRRRVDVDNLLKTFMDACNSILWHDDSQVKKAYISKQVANNPRVEIVLEKLGESP